MIGDDLKTYLETVSALTAIVSTRIYRSRAPQGLDEANAHIVYRVLGREPRHYSGSASGIPAYLVECEVFARTPRLAELAKEQLRLALDGYRGTFGSGFVTRAMLTDETDIDIRPVHGDERGYPGIRCDFEIAYTETVTSF